MSGEEVRQIAADLAHVKERIRLMEAGQRGVVQAAGDETAEEFAARNPHAGQAFVNRLAAMHTKCHQLEVELVHAKLAAGHWNAAEVIARMERT